MSCFYPRDAWRSQHVNENGKRPLVFQRSAGFTDMALQVPCGKCAGCRADQALMWSIRCYQEASLFDRNCFLTLTYDDGHLPDDGKLKVKDLQDFFKRLRHVAKVRYYACGEYGEKTKRPHYHAVIFGQDFKAASNVQIGDDLYTDRALVGLWTHGQVSVGSFTMASACYVAGYVGKKTGDQDSFQVMSRRPGIGKEWLMRYWRDLQRTGVVVIEGREYPIPQRYLLWMEDELKEVKADRKRKVDEKYREKGYFEIDRELRAKEVYQRDKIRNQKLNKAKL